MQLFSGTIELKGLDVYLYESWHKKITDSLKNHKADFPRLFDIKSSFINPKNKETIYIAESKTLKNKNAKKIKLAFSEFTLRFILGEEAEIKENCGFSFNEYLPMTNTDILITSNTTLSEIQPARFELAVGDITLPDKSHCLLVTFVINFLNGKGFTNLRYYTRKVHIASWKLINSDDVSYMTSYERMIRDTFIHKEYVVESAKILSRYLMSEGATIHANELMKRAYVHDNSKICDEDELIALSRIPSNNSMTDANESLSEIGREAIALHHKNNSHHPEHYESVLDMTKLDIMEMCCDWHARSRQYGTNFLEFVNTRQQNRFHFPNFMFQEIMFYCKILDNKLNKKK